MSVERNPYFNRIMIRDHKDFVGREREVEKIFSRIGAARPQSVAMTKKEGLPINCFNDGIMKNGNLKFFCEIILQI